MSHYIIAKIDITDRAEYAKYEEGFMAVFSQFEGKILAADESPLSMEGAWSCTRTVLIEFPSSETAMDWYNSDGYQHIATHRFAASTADVAMLSGL